MSTENVKRSLVCNQAWRYLGKPYIWGGDDPVGGFDCSGLVVELFKSVGKLPRQGDWTAHDLWLKFKDKYKEKYATVKEILTGTKKEEPIEEKPVISEKIELAPELPGCCATQAPAPPAPTVIG